MTAKIKMKKYISDMFSTKESTSSTDRLLASQTSVLAASSSVAPLLLHSLPIRSNYQNRRPVIYQPTTVSVHATTRYDKVCDTTEEFERTKAWGRYLKEKRKMSGEGKLGQNLRQAYGDGQGKELDPKHPSIQDNFDASECQEEGESRVLPQVLAALSVSMGSLIVGFASGYTSPAEQTMLNDTSVEITHKDISWIGGFLPLAALLGGIAGGPMIDTLGRKMTILATALPFILSWVLIAFAVNVPIILAGRAVAGFCIGIITLALPVYLGETVQPEVRGSLGLLPTAFGNTGILIVFTAGMFLNWWHLALLGAIIPIPFLILMCIIPETPSWYTAKDKKEQAKKSLQWLRGKDANITKELEEIEQTAIKNQRGGSSLNSLFSKSSIKPLAISIGLMFFQQMSGINAVIFYTNQIFQDTGSTLDKNICSIIVGCVNFISTFIATLVIDKMGRKMLLYISSISMTLTLAVLGTFMYLKDNMEYDMSAYSTIPLISMVIYIITFSLGLGPIPWLMMGEILPAKIRAPAASISTAFNWTCTSAVTLSFSELVALLGIGTTFWMFGFFCLISFFFVLFCVPETRGKSLDDIERKFQKNVRRMSSIANLKPSPLSV